MHFGIIMECDYREEGTMEDAFQEAFTVVDMAEKNGLDGVWLAERHFAAPKRPTDAFGAGIPSIVSVPMIMASAIASRTERLRIGMAVAVLPLCHPIRMAEEAATVDQVSRGRLEFGVGRSGFARAYEGYGIPYAESRERFQESLEIILKAWTEHRFSHQGTHFNFDDVCVVPKPYQKPHPPIRIAATTQDTFPQVGQQGLPVFVGLRGFAVPELGKNLDVYRQARQEAGHTGEADVLLRIPVYVAETAEKAREDAEVSTMKSYQRLAETFARSAGGAGTFNSEERSERSKRLASVTYDELLKDRLAYGTPDMVIERLSVLTKELGLSGVVIEPNVGGGIPVDRMLNSIKLFAKEVVPALR
ncbi:MAG: hypothetical protein BZY75_03790 [SAR202 cluster bacterium Io17-Chloro-G7]|nr:MAG: hypothetical protein BZY75_03790 [SAR202 cluster bacterium Io17-Chloro-G7]